MYETNLSGTSKGTLFFIPTDFVDECPASLRLPRKLNATTLEEAWIEIKNINDMGAGANGIVCQQISSSAKDWAWMSDTSKN